MGKSFASGGAAAEGQQHWLRAGAAAARGFRPPRGCASCSNTRARYIHVPLGRNPLAATSFAAWRSSFRRGMPEPASTKPRTSNWRKTRWCGDRAQAGHGWPALACWSHGWRNQAMGTIPALPRLPPKATYPGASRPHRRCSPRSQRTPALWLWLKPEPRTNTAPAEVDELQRFGGIQGRERDRGVDNRPCYTARPLSQARSR